MAGSTKALNIKLNVLVSVVKALVHSSILAVEVWIFKTEALASSLVCDVIFSSVRN